MKKFLNNRNEKLFNKLFENQGISIKELDVAKMTAWQALEEEDETIEEVHLGVTPDENPLEEPEETATDIVPDVTDVTDVEDAAVGNEEEYELEENTNMQDGALEKIERAFNPVTQVLKTIDTPPELQEFLSAMVNAIEELSNGALTPEEVTKTLRGLLNNKSGEETGENEI